jgi:hypothetical protein
MGSGISGLFSGTRGNEDENTKQNNLSDDNALAEAYRNKVAAGLNQLLAQANDRDADAINKHLDEIRKTLDKETDGTINILFGGSVSKHTYVDGLSDIDALVTLNGTDLEQKSPGEVKAIFARMLKERYPKSKIWTGKLAVTLQFSDGCQIQLLPAIKSGNGFNIAGSSGKKWSQIDPQKFAEKLTKVNQSNGGKVIPIIKLAKSIIGNFPQSQKLTGYHVESLAVEIFKNYKGEKTPKAMLEHFFKQASSRVLSPITDKTGQSVHTDDMGKPNNALRKTVASALDRISRKMTRADNTQSVDTWKELFE